MISTPNGQLLPTASGRDLVITRTFRAPIDDVWASITESERTARWFGAWSGTAGPGRIVRYSMGFEKGAPEGEMRIEVCDAPRHLSVTTMDASGNWRLEAHLSEADGVTELRFTHHLEPKLNVGEVGPGWEYYLDMLIASRDDAPMPVWDDYFPSQKEYYLELERNLTSPLPQ